MQLRFLLRFAALQSGGVLQLDGCFVIIIAIYKVGNIEPVVKSDKTASKLNEAVTGKSTGREKAKRLPILCIGVLPKSKLIV